MRLNDENSSSRLFNPQALRHYKYHDKAALKKSLNNEFIKGNPAPIWMTKGIKATDKGLKSGLELSKQKIQSNKTII